MNMIGLLMKLLLNYVFSRFVDLVAGLFKRRAITALRNAQNPHWRAINDKKKP